MTNEIRIRAQKGDEEAINQVLKYYNGSVHHQAKRHVEPGSTYWDDYMQEGRLALLTALHDADLSKEEGFYNFSALVMRSHMHKFRDQTSLVPFHHFTHVNQYRKLKNSLEQERKSSVDMEEVLSAMNKKPFEKRLIREATRVEQLRMEDDEGSTKWLDSEIANQDLDNLRDSRGVALKSLLRILTPHQRDVVHRFYYDGQIADEIADELNLDRQSIWGCLRLARKRLERYKELAYFFLAFESEHFLDVDHVFEQEIWKSVNGFEYDVSNYGRVKKVNHWHRNDFIVKPMVNQQNYGYRLYSNRRIGNRYEAIRFSCHNLLKSHFTENEYPQYYERVG